LILSQDFNDWTFVHSNSFSDVNIIGGDFGLLKLVPDTKLKQHRVDIPTKEIYTKGIYRFTVLAKKAGQDFIRLRIGNIGYDVVFDLNKGIVLGTQKDVVANIVKEDNNWFKCSLECKFLYPIKVVRINAFNVKSRVFYSGNDLDGVYLSDFNLKKVYN
jgi:hypothetical protein